MVFAPSSIVSTAVTRRTKRELPDPSGVRARGPHVSARGSRVRGSLRAPAGWTCGNGCTVGGMQEVGSRKREERQRPSATPKPPMTHKAVYFDERLPCSWIDKQRWGTVICKHFRQANFDVKDAAALSDWVKARLHEGSSQESVIVFAQDIAPRDIVQSCPNGLLRRYLDEGGRAVWIGDTPLWTQTVAGDPKKDREEIWNSGLHSAILGVQPLMAELSSGFEWHPHSRISLRSRWVSMRPVAFEVSSSWKNWPVGGLVIRPLARAQTTLLPSGWNSLVIARWRQAGRRVSSIGASVAGMGGSVSVDQRIPKELSLEPLWLACAWHVSYGRAHGAQGFYRLWDCGSEIDSPPAALLEDMLTLATTERVP